MTGSIPKKKPRAGANRDRGKTERVIKNDYITTADFFTGLARWHAAKPKFEMRALYEEVGRQYNVVAAIKTGSGKEIKAPLFDLVRQRCEDFLAKLEQEPE